MSAAPNRKARPARPPAPELPSFDKLDRTHHQVMLTLARFEQLLAHIDDNGADDVARKEAGEIFAFFDKHARQHHADEESLVFPQLLAAGDAVLTQHVLRLQQDHGWLEQDWMELSPQIEAIAKGYSWWDLAVLREALPIFTDLYREHIALEESIVYPEARRRQQALRDGQTSRTS